MKVLFAVVAAAVVLGGAQTAWAGNQAFYLVEEKDNKMFITDAYMQRDNPTTGAICLERAHEKTYDPVNLNITKKVYECVLGPLSLKEGQEVHAIGNCAPSFVAKNEDCGVDVDEIDRILDMRPENRRNKVYAVFLQVAPGPPVK